MRNYVTIGKVLEKLYLLIEKTSHPALPKPNQKKYKRCMMRTNRFIETENSKLLMDIVELRIKLSNLYSSTGPNTSEYVSLSIKLDCLMKEYFDEKIAQIV